MTIRTLLEHAVARRPTRTALRYRRHGAWVERSYAEVYAGVCLTAEAFGRLELRPGRDVAALMLDNGPEWVESYLALAGAGVAVVPVDPKLRAGEVAFLLQDSGAALVVADARQRGVLEQALAEAPAVRDVVLTGLGASTALAGRPARDYEALRAAVGASPPAWFAARQPAPQDLASIIYTSGTTGRPKGAMLTHNNFCSDVLGAMDAIGPEMIDARDDFLVVLPLFHSFSFTANLLLPLYNGSGMLFVESLRTVGEDLRLLRPTVLMAVPLLAEKLLARVDAALADSRAARVLLRCGLGRLLGPGVRRAFGGRLRFIVTGGAPCPPHVLRGFRRVGLRVVEGYGLTECSPVVSINSLRAPRLGTIGRKLPNIEVRIAEADGQGVGELQVRGPVVMKGYFRNLEATREAFDGEWFRTGDLAAMDAEGFLTIRGRKKALIVNREGKNIYPEEVEQALARDPLVADVVVLGYTAGGVPGERVGALVVPAPEALRAACGGAEPAWDEAERLLREAVRRQCESLAEYKHPRKVVVRREPLERTSIQKVRRCAYQGALDE